MTTLPRPLKGSEPAPTVPAAVPNDPASDVLEFLKAGVPPASPPGAIARALSALDTASGHPAPVETVGQSRRREIIDAASELFAVHGYRGTSLRQISGKVGISHPGMLHHFTSKDALLDAVIDDLEAHAQHVIDHIDTFDALTREDVEQIMARDFRTDPQRLLLIAVLSTEAVDPEFPGRMRMIRLRRVHEHIAEHVLRAFEARGELVDGLDLEWAARMLISSTISLITREATIGAVQPSRAGVGGPDYLRLTQMLLR